MQKPLFTVLIEATVVGILLLVLFQIITYLMKKHSLVIRMFITGALFHILCEISGVNAWYAKEYCKLLKTH
jgi:hypothetical protein